MKLLIKLLRIYTPFICTLTVFINGVLFSRGGVPEGFTYLASCTCGYSILVVIYFFITTMRMCTWYKLNLLCLFLVQLCGLAYKLFDVAFPLYVNAVILLSAMGMIFFLIFRIFYRVTSALLCTRRYLRTEE